ncbi:MAG: ubiquinol-cytochrome c reductase iron-sulfur subunit [Halobacteria archaeon]
MSKDNSNRDENEMEVVDEEEKIKEINEVPSAKRRGTVKFMAGIAGAAAIGTFAVSAIDSAERASERTKKLNYKTIFKKGARLVDRNGNPAKKDSLKKGSGDDMTVFPEKKGGGALTSSKKQAVLLVRFDPDDYYPYKKINFSKQTKELNKHPGYRKKFTADGYAAYSKLCNHAGCLVEQRSGPDNKYFHCQCHQSSYDPLKGCKVVGGPSPRALAQLPIKVNDSNELILVTKPFIGPLGPHHSES